MPQIITEIRTRIQFLVTIEIFFSTLIYTFFKIAGSEEIISSTNALIWGIGVAFCILNYLSLGIVEKPKRVQLVSVRFLVSFNILLFVLPILLLVAVTKSPLPDYYIWPFKISFLGTLVMPFLTFLVILGIQYWQEFRLFLELLRRKKK